MVKFFKPKQKEVSSKHFGLTIHDIDIKGRGVAKLDNVTWFVKGTLPGEEVVVRAIDVKKDIGNAELISIKKRSPRRIKPICQFCDKCGGCSLMHMTVEDELNEKVKSIKRLFKKQLGFEIIEEDEKLVSQESSYRRVARLSILADRKEFHIGFKEAFGKKIVEVDKCPIMVGKISNLIKPLREMYKQLSNYKIIGHIELVDALPKPVVLFRAINIIAKSDIDVIRNFAEQNQVIVYTLSRVPKDKNEITDKEIIEVVNSEALEENVKPYYNLLGEKIHFLPNDFIQINESMNEKLVLKVLEYLNVTQDDEVLDLFSGVGNFSLPIARKVKHVYAVEGVWDMVKAGQLNAQLNNIDNLEFCVHNLEEDFENTVWAKSNVSKALMDPGRQGGHRVTKYLIKRNVRDVVYVSCNPQTLIRDLKEFIDSGYQIQKWSVFDMFPRTSHVETVVLLSRDKA